MAIRFRRVSRLCDPTNKEAGKKVYPVISYQYDTSATLDEFAKEIASASGVSEGETISVLKDFRTLLRKTLLGGRSVNIAGLGYFYLSAQSKGTEKAEDFTIANISGLRICLLYTSDAADERIILMIRVVLVTVRMMGVKLRIRMVVRVVMVKHQTQLLDS